MNMEELMHHEDNMKERFEVLIEKALYETDRRGTAKEFARYAINDVVESASGIEIAFETKKSTTAEKRRIQIGSAGVSELLS